MDNSCIDKPGTSAFGGVLKDYNGCFLYIFSYSIGKGDSSETEFLAIKKALSILAL